MDRLHAARPRAALALALALAACDTPAAAPRDPEIPADHPCPSWALAPASASLYDDAVDALTPVPLALALPLPAGLPVTVSQGHLQLPTHLDADAFAWDFALPLGTPVHAAAPGLVAYVRDDSTAAGPDPALRGAANFVLVDHGGGLFTAYVHLAAGSATVAPGDEVAAGDVLALTGLSGQMSGPHLHFAVENAWGETLPARFVDPDARACALDPGTGDVVTAGAGAGDALVYAHASSPLPSDTFAATGVSALAGLPARLFEAEHRYRVRGTAPDPAATAAWVLLIPAGGGTAVASWRFPIHSGAFEGDLRLTAPAGRYGLGAVAVAEGAEVRVPSTVRVSVQ